MVYNKKGDLVMSLILCYCEKCGQHYDTCDEELKTLKNVICIGCCNTGYFKPVPKEYLNDGGWDINKKLEEEFTEKILKSSPNFDPKCFDGRLEYQETRKHYDEMLKNEMQEQKNIPKCPTCSSTDIQKIGTGERITSIAMLGIFSKKINKSFKCNKCGYMW